MVSSTALDLPEHRKEVLDACLRQGAFPTMVEHLPASDAEAIRLSAQMIDEAEIYLGVLGHRYGYVPEGHSVSITEMEYNRAVERGLTRFIFLMHDDHPVRVSDVETGEGAERLRKFKERLKSENVVNFFKSPVDLRAHVINSLSQYRERHGRRDMMAFHYAGDIPQPPEPYIVHPYTFSQTHDLVGRNQELSLLTDWATRPGTDIYKARVLNVVAIGGMGKSALAWKWFNDIAPQEMKPLAGRMWWSFYESDATFEGFIVRALAYVTERAREEIERDTRPGEREEQLLAVINREPFLFVLDGFEQTLVAYARNDADRLAGEGPDEQTAERIADALGPHEGVAQSFTGKHRLRMVTDPRAGNFLRKLTRVQASRVLVNTRLFPADLQTATGAPVVGSHIYSLAGLSDDDALNLWRAFSISGAPASLLPIFNAAGNHPLLIQTLASEVANYRRAPGDFDAWRQAHPDFDPFSMPLAQARTHVLASSLRGLSAAAGDVLRVAAAFRMPVTYDALLALLVGEDRRFKDEATLLLMLTELEDRGLLSWDRRANRYGLHPVVRGTVWGNLSRQDKEGIYQSLHDYFAAIPKVDDQQVRSVEDLTPAIELYNALVNLSRYGEAALLFGSRLRDPLSYRLGASRRAVELLELLFPDGLDELPRVNGRGARSFILNELGFAYLQIGNLRRTTQLLQRIETIDETVNDRGNIAQSQSNLATVLLYTGALREAEMKSCQALPGARSSHRADVEVYVLESLGKTLSTRGMVNEASFALERASRMCKVLQEPTLEATVSLTLGQQALWLGDFIYAQQLADRASAAATLSPRTRGVISSKEFQGLVASSIGDLAKADENLREALSLARQMEFVGNELRALVRLAEVRQRQGDFRAARALLEDVWGPAERGPYVMILTDAYNALARIERDAGNTPAAIEAAAKAYRAAWCDGPPFAYHWGLETARAHLIALHAAEPEMPPFDEYKYEPLPEVEIDPPDEFAEPGRSKKKAHGRIAESKRGGEKITPPVYLLSLTLENVRSFGEAQVVNLSDGAGRPAAWTVILGDNGVGKTTLLQCIAALDPSLEPSFLREQRLFMRQGMKAEPMMDHRASRHDGPARSRVSASIHVGTKLKEGRKAWKESYDFIRSRGVIQRAEVERLVTLDDLICYGYGASRHMENSALTKQPQAENSASLFSDDVALLNAEEWLLQMDYAAAKSSTIKNTARKNFDDVKNLLIQLLPDVQDIRIDPPEPDRPQAGVSFKTPYGWVPVQSLSVGYRTMIAWMVDLARRMFARYPDALRPIAEPAIVLIDEIDLHLHPQWQRTLMSYLGGFFENTQFIVTAHSPLVVQAASNANIVLLRQQEGKDSVEVVNDRKVIRGWRVDQVLTSGLFGLPSARPAELDELLGRRQQILSKAVLSDEDEKELDGLNAQLGELSGGETVEDMEAMEVINRAASVLKKLEESLNDSNP
jgi:tetratricopeptide (TPR) repeat protein/energy-coupling factor transporter ATP-binding protein EcfA2